MKHVIEHASNGGRLRCLDDDKIWFDDRIKLINFITGYIETEEGMMIELSDFGDFVFMVKRPLTDLTKKQMIILSKLVGDIHNDDMDDKFICTNSGRMLVKTPWDGRIEFFWKSEDKTFTVYNTYHQKEKRVRNTLAAYELLRGWDYDLSDLLEGDSAININTLK